MVRTPFREELRRFLAEAGVASEVHYPVPCHRQPAVLARMKTSPLPFTEKACAEILSLPLFPTIADAELAYVAKTVKAFFSKKRVTAT